MAFRSVDRNSKFYSMHTFGKALHVELHPNTTSGGYFRIKNAEEGEALIGRLQEGIDALREADAAAADARAEAASAESESRDNP